MAILRFLGILLLSLIFWYVGTAALGWVIGTVVRASGGQLRLPLPPFWSFVANWILWIPSVRLSWMLLWPANKPKPPRSPTDASA